MTEKWGEWEGWGDVLVVSQMEKFGRTGRVAVDEGRVLKDGWTETRL